MRDAMQCKTARGQAEWYPRIDGGGRRTEAHRAASGDRILVDTSQRVPVPPGIFVIWDGLGLVAKRIEHVPHSSPPTVVIRSINPEYATYERHAEDVRIVGRVIWMARKL